MLTLPKNRLEALIDGAFAIVITLHAFNLKLPDGMLTEGGLASHVLHLWPRFLAYIISVVITGIFWVAHHMQFHYIHRTDRMHLWINLVFLACVGLLPFSSGLLGEYPLHRTSCFVYGLNLTLVGLTLLWQWQHAVHRYRLVDPHLPVEVVRAVQWRVMRALLFYAGGALAAFVDTRLSLLLFVTVPLLYIPPTHMDRHLARHEGSR